MIKIRKFDANDFPSILKIERECFGEYAYSKEIFGYLSGLGNFLVAEEKQILGYILYSEGNIFSIAVRPEFQGKGIGRMLLSKALDDLKYKTEKVWLQTRESNLKAQNFFSKFGFKPVRKLKNYYRNGDGILMVKELSSSA